MMEEMVRRIEGRGNIWGAIVCMAVAFFFPLVAVPAALAGGEDFCVTQLTGLSQPAVDSPLLDIPYALVKGKQAVPVYATPTDEGQGKAPLRILPAGYIGLSLESAEPIEADGHSWYQINKGEYVRAETLQLLTVSTYEGILVPPGMDQVFAWVLFNSQVYSKPGELPELDALTLPERSLVYIHEIEEVNGEKWCNIGCGGWLPYRRLGLVIPRLRPEGVGATERWIDVSLNEQTLAAYEGNRMVFSTLVSTGISRFPTVQGVYRIYYKVEEKKMSGGEPGDDLYFLEDVLWQMFFYQGYALHASYWHDIFGLPTSHGCVNLSPRDALWLYGWTTASQTIPSPPRRHGKGVVAKRTLGTAVWIHE